MKQITRLNPALCPRTIAAILDRLSDGREIAVFRGLAYVATVGGEVWHVAINDATDVQPYANEWTDESFGFPPAIRIGVWLPREVEPVTLEVDQPQGHNAAEMLAEAQHRLAQLLTSQLDALPQWAQTDQALEHEIGNCLRSIQRLAATPADRCVA